jgi:tight adherence protein B
MTGVMLATLASAGVYLVYTSVAFGWRDLRLSAAPEDRRRFAREWARRAGLDQVPVRDTVSAVGFLAVAGFFGGLAVFGGPFPATVIACFAASFPVASHRAGHVRRRAAAMDAWPRLLEELRIQTASLGRSVPQALFDVGRHAPAEMRPAFAAAHREWLLSTDFVRTVHVLKAGLADPTADAACETLLVAHEIGGSDLDRRLDALIDDRIQDTQGRKDARARQAGARFARRFVILVPAGMALAGMSVGTGRSAYRTPTGQVLVVVAILLVVGCWAWAGRVMALPEERRVFDG